MADRVNDSGVRIICGENIFVDGRRDKYVKIGSDVFEVIKLMKQDLRN